MSWGWGSGGKAGRTKGPREAELLQLFSQELLEGTGSGGLRPPAKGSGKFRNSRDYDLDIFVGWGVIEVFVGTEWSLGTSLRRPHLS